MSYAILDLVYGVDFTENYSCQSVLDCVFENGPLEIDGEEIGCASDFIEIYEHLLDSRYSASGNKPYFLGQSIFNTDECSRFCPADIPTLSDKVKKQVDEAYEKLPKEVLDKLKEKNIRPKLFFLWSSS